MSGPNGRFDLDAKRKERAAAAAESAGEQFSFVMGGRGFTIAPQREWPIYAKAMLDNADFHLLLDKIIDDPEAFRALEPTIGDAEDIFSAWGEWAGIGDLPESSASPPRALTPM